MLRAVDWAAAGWPEIPLWVLGLLSADEDRRNWAYERVFVFRESPFVLDTPENRDENGDLQANVDLLATDAFVHAVPILIAVLQHSCCCEPAEILSRLGFISAWVKDNRLDAMRMRRAKAIDAILRQNVLLFLSFLNSTNQYDRGSALWAVHNILENKPSILDRLHAHLDVADNQLSHEVLKICDYLLGIQDGEVGKEIINIISLALKPPYIEKLGASTYLLLYRSMLLPTEQAVNLLADALAANTNINRIFDIASRLLQSTFTNHRTISPLWVTPVRENDIVVRVDITPGPHFEPNDVLPLSNARKQALHALIEKDEFWSVPSRLLEVFGLPTTREGLQTLLDDAN